VSSRLKNALVATALASVATAALATPASAVTPRSGGGCGTTGTSGGASYKACISQSGNYINFDGYVTSSVSCYAHVTLFRDGSAVETGPDTNCQGTSVHIPGGSWSTQSGHTWYSIIFVSDNGNYDRVSPNLYS
jgi:hypothetical protein